LVALFLFQVGSGVYLATHSDVHPTDRFRTFQIARGIFLAAYVLGHMNSVFVFCAALSPHRQRLGHRHRRAVRVG